MKSVRWAELWYIIWAGKPSSVSSFHWRVCREDDSCTTDVKHVTSHTHCSFIEQLEKWGNKKTEGIQHFHVTILAVGLFISTRNVEFCGLPNEFLAGIVNRVGLESTGVRLWSSRSTILYSMFPSSNTLDSNDRLISKCRRSLITIPIISIRCGGGRHLKHAE